MTAASGEHEVRKTAHMFPGSYTKKRNITPYIVLVLVVLAGLAFAFSDKLPF